GRAGECESMALGGELRAWGERLFARALESRGQGNDAMAEEFPPRALEFLDAANGPPDDADVPSTEPRPPPDMPQKQPQPQQQQQQQQKQSGSETDDETGGN